MKMKLWLVQIGEGAKLEYDSYSAFVFASKTKREALSHNPGGVYWPSQDQLTVTYLGVAKHGTKTGMILGSFNAG